MKNPFIKQVFDSSSTPSIVNSSLSTDSSSSLSTVYRPPFTRKLWTALPNFVDCAVFRPVASLAEKQAVRQSLGIPEAAFVVGCVAAVKKHHKRIDYLINEFARLSNAGKRISNIDRQDRQDGNLDPIIPESSCISCPSMLNPYLLIAGAKTDETAELIALAESLIPGRYKIMIDCSRDQMPDLLRSMDVFVLTSLFEMMPIALLEALASGLPCVVNAHPVLQWMAGVDQLSCQVDKLPPPEKVVGCQVAELLGESPFGRPLATQQLNNPTTALSALNNQQLNNSTTGLAGGKAIDMSQECALAGALAKLTPEWLAMHGRQVRERAVKMFSTEAVIEKYVKYYGEVMRNDV